MNRLVDRLSFAIIGALALALVAVIATIADAGPLDPSDAPSSTDGVRLPGTPIDEPTTISAPGHYYLTRDIAIDGPTAAIIIDADDVTLDLGGFTLSGTDAIFSYGVRVEGPQRGIAISNGLVRDFTEGISVATASHVRISDVVATQSGAGFRLGEDAVLTDCTASDSSTGIYVTGSRAVIRGCQVSANDQIGVVIEAAHDVLVERSSIKGNNHVTLGVPGGGIWVVNSQRSTIRDNDFGDNRLQAPSSSDIYIQSGADHVIIDNVLNCPSSILQQGPPSLPTNVFAPVNTSDSHTNHAHQAAC